MEGKSTREGGVSHKKSDLVLYRKVIVMTNEEKLTQLREMWKTADPDQRKTIEERAQEIKDNIAKEKGMPRRKTIQEMQKDLLKKAAEAKARGFVK